MDIAVPIPRLVEGVEKRIVSQLAQEAEQWSWCVNALTKWEEEHLLDEPTPEVLREHKQTLELLLKVGRILSRATEHPDFPDHATAEMVRSTQACFEDMFVMRHGPRLARKRADEILAAAFPV